MNEDLRKEIEREAFEQDHECAGSSAFSFMAGANFMHSRLEKLIQERDEKLRIYEEGIRGQMLLLGHNPRCSKKEYSYCYSNCEAAQYFEELLESGKKIRNGS